MQAADSRVCEHIRDVQNHVTAHCSAVVVAVYDTSCVVRVVLTKRESIIHHHLFVLNGLTNWKWITNRLCEHKQQNSDPHQNTSSE